MGLVESIEKYKKVHEALNLEITDNLLIKYVEEVFENFKARVEVGRVYDIEEIDTIISEELNISETNFIIYAHERLMDHYSCYNDSNEPRFKDTYEEELYDVIQGLFAKIELYDSYGTDLDEAAIKFEYEVEKIGVLLDDEFECDIRILNLELVYPKNKEITE